MSRTLACWLGAAILLAGCTQRTDDPHGWVAHQQAKPGVAPPPLPALADFEVATAATADARDPFGLGAVANSPRPDPERPGQPLEQYALDSLKMVGTLGTGADLQALIEDPTGTIHRIRRGAYLGRNYGRVVGIEERRIDLLEQVPDGRAGWAERKAGLALPEP